MRLLKYELYKICRNKLFIAGVIIISLLQVGYFALLMGEETSFVDGVKYTGYQAVKMNQRITEEYEGFLTDETVDAIIARYGFPQEVQENQAWFYDANFLNFFVVSYFSDGYYCDWNDYKVAAKTIPISESGIALETGRGSGEIYLEYYRGYEVLADSLNVGMIFVSIVIMIAVSVVFSDEKQTGMVPLLFTCEKGRKEDIRSKIEAAFIVSVSVFLFSVGINFLMYFLIYGTGKWQVMAGLALQGYVRRYFVLSTLPVGRFLLVYLGISLLGILLLCASSLFISARAKNNFQAVAVSALFWCLPILISLFSFRFFYTVFACSLPILLVNISWALEFTALRCINLLTAAALTVIFVIAGYRSYRES